MGVRDGNRLFLSLTERLNSVNLLEDHEARKWSEDFSTRGYSDMSQNHEKSDSIRYAYGSSSVYAKSSSANENSPKFAAEAEGTVLNIIYVSFLGPHRISIFFRVQFPRSVSENHLADQRLHFSQRRMRLMEYCNAPNHKLSQKAVDGWTDGKRGHETIKRWSAKPQIWFSVVFLKILSCCV